MILIALALAADEVLVQGRVESTVAGPVRVELIQTEPGSPQLLLAEVILDAPGSFRLAVPPTDATVYLRAASDTALDGTGPSDPQATRRVDLSGEPVTDLVLTLRLP